MKIYERQIGFVVALCDEIRVNRLKFQLFDADECAYAEN